MQKTYTLKDHQQETQLYRKRLVAASFFVIFFISLLIARAFYLQILQYDLYHTISEENRVQLEPISPTRGLIFDRNGVLLADNRPSYTLTLTKERLPNLDKTLQALQSLVAISATDIDKFQRRLQQRRRPYEAVPLRFKLNEEEIARVMVNRYRLPGVEITADLIRYYPFGYELAHTLGYIGRINEEELASIDVANYSGTHHIGKLGIEKYYEPTLHGKTGYQKIESNAHGRLLRVLERTDPTPGQNLNLYLDIKLQQAAITALADRAGAVVGIDPQTGGVLILASTPAYDPNLFVNGIDTKSYQALQNDAFKPLLNRAIRGQYPPGSTIKPLVGLAGLYYGVVDYNYSIFDPGWYKLGGQAHKYRDWKKGGHGYVNLNRAIVQSCDTYFYNLAHKLEIDRLSIFLKHFQLGQETGIDMLEELPGLMPSKEWKQQMRGQPWYPGETLSVGIGQGFMLATPLQLAVAMAILANKGKIITPRLAKAADNSFFDIPLPLDIKDEHRAYIVQAMQEVVHSPVGTARAIGKDIQYFMAGKTGTAQVIGIKQNEKYDASRIAAHLRDHALFVAFAPIENPEIALAILVENGQSGSGTAAPIARTILDSYFALKSSTATTEKTSP